MKLCTSCRKHVGIEQGLCLYCAGENPPKRLIWRWLRALRHPLLLIRRVPTLANYKESDPWNR